MSTPQFAPAQASGRLPIHALLYGEAGTFKSTLAATFPKPLLVWNFESIGNDAPYLRQGTPGPLLVHEHLGFYYRSVFDASGVEIIRIEYYHDPDPEKDPSAWDRFRTRMDYFTHEYDQWQTVSLESVDFADIACRNAQRFLYNKETKEPRQWRAETTDQLENMFKMRFGGFPMNVVTVTGVSEQRDERHGMFVRNPSAPGRLRKEMARAYAEVYHSYMIQDPASLMWVPQLQTQANDQYVAKSTMLNAPNPCWPTYEALWANYNGGGG